MSISAGEVKVHFVGAGPGDPRLMTLHGRALIEQADVIIYADSLVDEALLGWAQASASRYQSSGMTLEETTAIVVEAARAGRHVVRLHSGDPSLYGAIREQMAELDRAGIDYAVVPGVSSLFASAAALGVELTVPELCQTVILARAPGRTPVPESESLRSLAAHQATIAVFLSINQIDTVSEDLIAGGYPPGTPAAVVYRASRPDQKIIRGTLQDIGEQTRQAGVHAQALILVGRALASSDGPGDFGGTPPRRSRLYDSAFTHGYRLAPARACTTGVAPGEVVDGDDGVDSGEIT